MDLSKLKGHIYIVDCYTDEPSGLGVPPYLGTYPRELFGALKYLKKDVDYITIDDLRLKFRFEDEYDKNTYDIKLSQKTNKNIIHATKKIISKNIEELNQSNFIFVGGIHTPGKYLSANPATLKEIKSYFEIFNKNFIYGPLIYGSGLYGGRHASKINAEIINLDVDKETSLRYSSKIANQIPWNYIVEIETGSGCLRNVNCSYCTEPLKNNVKYRDKKDIVNEIKNLYENGAKNFRLGKQTCFYSYQYSNPDEIENLLKGIWNVSKPTVLHIDNVNPQMVITENGEKITKSIVKYTTAGNIAAFGIETFDPEVIKKNNLNSTPSTSIKAIEIINKYGKLKGENGMPKFLPGINILLGLPGETKKTQEYNMQYLNEILNKNLLLRRINIREVVVFDNTPIADMKLAKKTKKYYWKWRNQIRQEIDFEMIKRTIPKNTILKNVNFEIYDGKHTFGRQIGTYPIVVGVNERITNINKPYNVLVENHMLRSVTGKIIK